MKPLIVECLLILNDADADAIALLKGHVGEALEKASGVPELRVKPLFMSVDFETAYSDIKKLLFAERQQNVIFNIDPCGNSLVKRSTIVDAMQSFRGGEVFFTFMIESLIAFLQKADVQKLKDQLRATGVDHAKIDELSASVISHDQWLGAAERLVYEAFMGSAPFVSPFSITNPDGWRYWLLHFAHIPRARQVYNDVLHKNSSVQAHFGRSGLDMLGYSPDDETSCLYLFDEDGRTSARNQLIEDIPKFVARVGDAVTISDFQYGTYNLTPAHSQDIYRAIFDNPDLEVVTPNGGQRRQAQRVLGDDILRLKKQPTFHFMMGPFKPR